MLVVVIQFVAVQYDNPTLKTFVVDKIILSLDFKLIEKCK